MQCDATVDMSKTQHVNRRPPGNWIYFWAQAQVLPATWSEDGSIWLAISLIEILHIWFLVTSLNTLANDRIANCKLIWFMYASIYIYVMLLIHPNLIFHFFFLEIRFSVIWWWHVYEYDAGDGEMLDAELNFLWS